MTKIARRLALAAALSLGAAALPSITHAATMQCAPNQVIQAATATYTGAPNDGIVLSVSNNDVPGMIEAGCAQVGAGGYTLVARLIGANMNITTDQTIPLLIPAGASYTPTLMEAKNCSISLTTAAGGAYGAATKGAPILFAAATAYSSCTGTGLTSAGALAAATGLNASLTTAPIFSLTTGQGSASTADIYVWGVVGN